jgi:hypothetical protein
MYIELIIGLILPFVCTFTVATIRSRRRKAEEPIICTIQGAA